MWFNSDDGAALPGENGARPPFMGRLAAVPGDSQAGTSPPVPGRRSRRGWGVAPHSGDALGGGSAPTQLSPRLSRGSALHQGHPRRQMGETEAGSASAPRQCEPHSCANAGRFGMTPCLCCLPFPAGGLCPRPAPPAAGWGDPRAPGGHSPAPALPSPLAMALIPLIKIISSGSHFGEPSLNLFAAGGWVQAGPRESPPAPHHGGGSSPPLSFQLPQLTGSTASLAPGCHPSTPAARVAQNQ